MSFILTAMGHPVINVESLGRTFTVGRGRRRSEIEAVVDLTFRVEAGERLAFIGPNGAGKSTSIKMLTGILHPTTGSAEVLGLTPWQHRRALAARIGTLFGQRSQLWEELPPTESLRVLAAIFGLDADRARRRIHEVGEVLEAVELFNQPMRTLSLGQRMRCELAACLLHEPELLFLDEPTIGLDLLGKRLFRELLIKINEEVGTTVLLTSHDVTDVEQVANRAIVVNHGTIIYDDSVQNMRQNLLATKRVEVGVANGDRLADVGSFGRTPGVSVSTLSPTRLLVDVDTAVQPISDLLEQILRTVPVADLSVVDPPLEQVIADIYERPA